MDSCILEGSESSSSGPFSVAEFGNLVALAFHLESQDRLSQTLLQFGKGLDGGDNPDSDKSVKPQHRAVSSSYCRSTTPGSQASTKALSNMEFVAAPALCQTNSTSRPRQLLNKIKRHASVATSRHESKERRTTIIQPRLSTTSLSRRSPVSFFEDSDSDEDYISPSPAPSITIHRPDTPKQVSSHSGFSIFSRPPSAISRPGTSSGRDSPDSLPPSPLSTRTRSSSTSSTASTITDACRTPTSPLFTSSGSSGSARMSPTIASNRWSLYADDMPHASHPPSPSEDGSLYSRYSFSEHPFATPCEEEDPFAKNAVQVVRGHGPGASVKSKRSRRKRRSPTASLPPTPPPSCPLPAPPTPGSSGEEDNYYILSDMLTSSASEAEASSEASDSSSSSSDESSSECDGSCEGSCDDENCDWTLGLGALPRDDAARLSALKADTNCKGSRRRRSGTITAKNVRQETDWTLSLPLKKVAFPGRSLGKDSKSEEEDIVRPASPTLPDEHASKTVYDRRRRASGAVRLTPVPLTIRTPAPMRSPTLNSSKTTYTTLPSGSELRVPYLKTSPSFPSSSALATGTSGAFKLPASYPNTPSGSGDESETFKSAQSTPSRYSRLSMSRCSLTSAFPAPPTTTPPGYKHLSSVQGFPFPTPPRSITPISAGPAPPRPPRLSRASTLLPIGPSSPSPRSPTSSLASPPRTIRKSASSMGSQLTSPRSLKTVKSERDVSAIAAMKGDSDYHTARESFSSQWSS